MILNNRCNDERLLSDLQKEHITKDNPILLIIAEKQMFLNNLTLTVLKISGVNYIVNVEEETNQIFDHPLPILTYSNIILYKQKLLQFLIDLTLGNLELKQYLERKTFIKDRYSRWQKILEFEEQKFKSFQYLQEFGVTSQKQYYNLVQNQIHLLNFFIFNKHYEKNNQNYKSNQLNIENLLCYQVLKSVQQNHLQTTVGYLISKNFPQIFDYQIHIRKRVNELEQILPKDLSIWIKKPGQDNIEPYDLYRVNWKIFSACFVITGLIYYKWVQ